MAEDHSSLSAKVFHSIREDILNGKYQANEELKEKNIGEELGVSRTPVREALRQLELEGLVHIIPNKGAFVENVTLKDIKDIYEIRTLLEGLCARWAAENITKEQLEELEETVFLSDFHYSKENWDQILVLDNRFHEIVYEACGSKELTRVLRDYHHYLQRIRRITLEQKERARASTDEHRAIAEALKARDAATAEECAKLHIKNTISNMDKIGWENLMK
ncbi:MAG: GntR family transcriptional regulator [Lachnospiraceae bacterium]|nr:GntR family transcriptional regulator [Agathobacter sp.]MDD6445936.1 GntR family transcriptional regulator [Lachnospiraceae bacterium]MDY4893397.1 GntR family transcriptional regulator [Agathobacter sp.]